MAFCVWVVKSTYQRTPGGGWKKRREKNLTKDTPPELLFWTPPFVWYVFHTALACHCSVFRHTIRWHRGLQTRQPDGFRMVLVSVPKWVRKWVTSGLQTISTHSCAQKPTFYPLLDLVSKCSATRKCSCSTPWSATGLQRSKLPATPYGGVRDGVRQGPLEGV